MTLSPNNMPKFVFFVFLWWAFHLASFESLSRLSASFAFFYSIRGSLDLLWQRSWSSYPEYFEFISCLRIYLCGMAGVLRSNGETFQHLTFESSKVDVKSKYEAWQKSARPKKENLLWSLIPSSWAGKTIGLAAVLLFTLFTHEFGLKLDFVSTPELLWEKALYFAALFWIIGVWSAYALNSCVARHRNARYGHLIVIVTNESGGGLAAMESRTLKMALAHFGPTISITLSKESQKPSMGILLDGSLANICCDKPSIAEIFEDIAKASKLAVTFNASDDTVDFVTEKLGDDTRFLVVSDLQSTTVSKELTLISTEQASFHQFSIWFRGGFSRLNAGNPWPSFFNSFTSGLTHILHFGVMLLGIVLMSWGQKFFWVGTSWLVASFLALLSFDLCYWRSFFFRGGEPRPYPSMTVAYFLKHWRLLRLILFLGSACLFQYILIVLGPDELFWLCVLSFPNVAINQVSFPNAIMRIAKTYRDLSFRIVVFRRNSKSEAIMNRDIVMPACGAFGHVITLKDPALVDGYAPHDMDGKSILTEVHEAVQVDEPKHWKAIVKSELAKCDFAVFDWLGDVTENMRWEFVEARKIFSLERIVVIRPENANFEAELEEDLVACQLIMPAKASENSKATSLTSFLSERLSALRKNNTEGGKLV